MQTTDTDTAGAGRGPAAADPHPAWWSRAEELRERINAPGTGDALVASLDDEQHRLRELIAATPARTPAGLVAQLRVALSVLTDGNPDRLPDRLSPVERCQARALRSATAALERLAREGRPMEGDAGIGGDFHPYDVKITLPEERLYGPSLLDRLEDVEVTLGHLASPTADDSYVRPRALDLPWRELRRIRLALAKLLNCDEDD